MASTNPLTTYQSSFNLPSLPTVPETDPSACVLDGFRIAIAQLLSDSLGLPIEQAYTGVDYGKKGEDFTVALPRFRLPGKVDELAKKVVEKVCIVQLTGRSG
jgi:arginyl-tRNA synthetase